MITRSKIIGLVISFFMLMTSAYSQPEYPYTSGQAVFVQSPFNSSLYTNYNYRPHDTAPHRLPPYTTNQAVFVQQPYASAQQTVTSYPTTYYNSLPYTENRYTSPSAFPSTVAPAYPFGNLGLFVSSPYSTTSQSSTYHYPYTGHDYTTTYTYPYTTSTKTIQYPPPAIERVPYDGVGVGNDMYAPAYTLPNVQQKLNFSTVYPQSYPSTTYYAYPVSTADKYPYPTTTTAVPEMIIEPRRARR